MIKLGDLITAEFPEHLPGGREQQGYRPAVVVGLPWTLGRVRFRMVVVVPVTTFRENEWAIANPVLYPILEPGDGGLSGRSVALIDQVRALDVSRVKVRKGTIAPATYARIASGLGAILGR